MLVLRLIYSLVFVGAQITGLPAVKRFSDELFHARISKVWVMNVACTPFAFAYICAACNENFSFVWVFNIVKSSLFSLFCFFEVRQTRYPLYKILHDLKIFYCLMMIIIADILLIRTKTWFFRKILFIRTI